MLKTKNSKGKQINSVEVRGDSNTRKSGKKLEDAEKKWKIAKAKVCLDQLKTEIELCLW